MVYRWHICFLPEYQLTFEGARSCRHERTAAVMQTVSATAESHPLVILSILAYLNSTPRSSPFVCSSIEVSSYRLRQSSGVAHQAPSHALYSRAGRLFQQGLRPSDVESPLDKQGCMIEGSLGAMKTMARPSVSHPRGSST